MPHPASTALGAAPALTPLAALDFLAPGEPNVESFSSFALRLADANTTPRTVMYRQGAVRDRAVPFCVELPNVMTGANNIASSPKGHDLAERLAIATGTPAVRHLSYFRPRSRVSLTRFTVPHQQWCPQCLAEDKEPYGRALWDLALATACPQHKFKLATRCQCKRQIGLLRGEVLANMCLACGSALSKTPVAKAEPAELLVADELGKFVAAASAGAIDWENTTPMHRLVELAEKAGHRTCSAMAAFYGDPIPCVSRMLEGTGWQPIDDRGRRRKGKTRDDMKPTLVRMFIYSLRVGISPSKLLLGQTGACGEITPVPIGKNAPKATRSPEDFDRAIKEHPVTLGLVPYPGVEVWAAELHVSPARLNSEYRELIDRLNATRAENNKSQREANWVQFKQEVANAIETTLRTHGRLTYELVYAVLPRPDRALQGAHFRHIKQEMQTAKAQLAAVG